MKLRSAFVPLFVVALIVGWFLSSSERVESTREAQLTDQVQQQLRPQSTRERVWQPRPETLLLTLESTDTAPLFGSLRLRVAPSGDLYVLDAGDLKIKHFRADGAFVQSFGEGRGQGPGELSTPTDYTIANDGSVWIADAQNGRIVVFDARGGLAETINMEVQPYRLSLDDTGGYFTMFALTADRLFGRFDAQHQSQETFGQFLEDQMSQAILLDGWIASTGNAGFVYGGVYSGLLSAYDTDGRLRFLTETINRRSLPKIIRNSKGMNWVDREAFRTLISLSVSELGIHAFGYFEEGVRKVGVVDTYSLDDGSYLYSHRLPTVARDAVVAGGHLYTIQQTSIEKWQFPAPALRPTPEPAAEQALVLPR